MLPIAGSAPARCPSPSASLRLPPRLPAAGQVDSWGARLLVGVAVTYMMLIVVIPFANVFIQAFSHGLSPFVETVQEPDFQQAVKMTLLLSAVAVPVNTVFGVQAALFLARNDFRGRTFLISLLDLPFSISPVITGGEGGEGAWLDAYVWVCVCGGWGRGGEGPRQHRETHQRVVEACGTRMTCLLPASCLRLGPEPGAQTLHVLLPGACRHDVRAAVRPQGPVCAADRQVGLPHRLCLPRHAAKPPAAPACMHAPGSIPPARQQAAAGSWLEAASHAWHWTRFTLVMLADSIRLLPPRPARAAAGMALATLFVTMPFVVRELLPILEQMDMAEEEAAQ